MDNLIMNAITSGTPGVTIAITTDQLKEAMAYFYEESQARTQKAIEANREQPTITRKEAAKALNVTLTTLWRWEKEGYLTPVKIGTKVLYRATDIEKMLTPKS